MRSAGVVAVLCLLAGCGESAPRSSTSSGPAPTYEPDAWVSITTPVTLDASPAEPDRDAAGASDAPALDATRAPALDAGCVSAASLDAGVDAAAPDGAAWANLDGCLVLAPAAPDPAPVACDMDAGPDSGVCPLPPSACADPVWLVYYDDGRCVAGTCVWQKHEVNCPSLGCYSGACRFPPTAPQ